MKMQPKYSVFATGAIVLALQGCTARLGSGGEEISREEVPVTKTECRVERLVYTRIEPSGLPGDSTPESDTLNKVICTDDESGVVAPSPESCVEDLCGECKIVDNLDDAVEPPTDDANGNLVEYCTCVRDDAGTKITEGLLKQDCIETLDGQPFTAGTVPKPSKEYHVVQLALRDGEVTEAGTAKGAELFGIGLRNMDLVQSPQDTCPAGKPNCSTSEPDVLSTEFPMQSGSQFADPSPLTGVEMENPIVGQFASWGTKTWLGANKLVYEYDDFQLSKSPDSDQDWLVEAGGEVRALYPTPDGVAVLNDSGQVIPAPAGRESILVDPYLGNGVAVGVFNVDFNVAEVGEMPELETVNATFGLYSDATQFAVAYVDETNQLVPVLVRSNSFPTGDASPIAFSVFQIDKDGQVGAVVLFDDKRFRFFQVTTKNSTTALGTWSVDMEQPTDLVMQGSRVYIFGTEGNTLEVASQIATSGTGGSLNATTASTLNGQAALLQVHRRGNDVLALVEADAQ